MAKYQRKVEEVDAYLIDNDNAEEIAKWCGGRVVEEINPRDSSDVHLGINVPTMTGVVRASNGYYVVLNERGSVEVQSAFVFESYYEPV